MPLLVHYLVKHFKYNKLGMSTLAYSANRKNFHFDHHPPPLPKPISCETALPLVIHRFARTVSFCFILACVDLQVCMGGRGFFLNGTKNRLDRPFFPKNLNLTAKIQIEPKLNKLIAFNFFLMSKNAFN